MIKVLLADDHTIVRRGLKQILESEPGLSVVYEASNGNEAIEYARSHDVDVVVMDITMPGKSGLEALKEIKRLKPRLPVLVLSMHPRDQYAVRVLKAGAAGYITKESAPDDLVDAIKRTVRGGRYISTEVAELLAAHIGRDNPDEPHASLSDRELEVFLSIGQGKSLTEIAAELNISIKTVSTYRSRIMEKTSLSSNAQITRYCVQYGLT